MSTNQNDMSTTNQHDSMMINPHHEKSYIEFQIEDLTNCLIGHRLALNGTKDDAFILQPSEIEYVNKMLVEFKHKLEEINKTII